MKYIWTCLFICCCSFAVAAEPVSRLVVIKNGVKTTIGTLSEYTDLDLLNKRRRAAGLRPLQPKVEMMKFARQWSLNQAKRRSMYHSGGKYPENVAMNSDGRASTFDRMWNNSSGHRRNRMGASWRYVGIGIVKGSNGVTYATEVFSR